MNKKTIIISIIMVFTLGLLLFSVRMANKPVKSKTTQATKETTTETVVTTTTEAKAEKGTEQTPEQNLETTPVSETDFWAETATLLEKSRQAGLPLYYHVTRKDPMQPAFTYAEAAGPFKLILKEGMASTASLTGILLGNGKATAIINEKIFRVGDIVEGKKIIAIEKNRVILKKGMDEEILRLGTN